MSMVYAVNKGSDIVESDFWDSYMARRGIIACSMNAGCFRLLLPDKTLGAGPTTKIIAEMKTAKKVLVEKTTAYGMRALYFVFDDGTPTPYAVLIGANQMLSGMPPDNESGRQCKVSVWIRGPSKVYESPATFMVVRA